MQVIVPDADERAENGYIVPDIRIYTAANAEVSEYTAVFRDEDGKAVHTVNGSFSLVADRFLEEAKEEYYQVDQRYERMFRSKDSERWDVRNLKPGYYTVEIHVVIDGEEQLESSRGITVMPTRWKKRT